MRIDFCFLAFSGSLPTSPGVFVGCLCVCRPISTSSLPIVLVLRWWLGLGGGLVGKVEEVEFNERGERQAPRGGYFYQYACMFVWLYMSYGCEGKGRRQWALW